MSRLRLQIECPILGDDGETSITRCRTTHDVAKRFSLIVTIDTIDGGETDGVVMVQHTLTNRAPEEGTHGAVCSVDTIEDCAFHGRFLEHAHDTYRRT